MPASARSAAAVAAASPDQHATAIRGCAGRGRERERAGAGAREEQVAASLAVAQHGTCPRTELPKDEVFLFCTKLRRCGRRVGRQARRASSEAQRGGPGAWGGRGGGARCGRKAEGSWAGDWFALFDRTAPGHSAVVQGRVTFPPVMPTVWRSDTAISARERGLAWSAHARAPPVPAEWGPSCRALLSNWRGTELAAALAGNPGLSALRAAHQDRIAAALHFLSSTHIARDFHREDSTLAPSPHLVARSPVGKAGITGGSTVEEASALLLNGISPATGVRLQ